MTRTLRISLTAAVVFAATLPFEEDAFAQVATGAYDEVELTLADAAYLGVVAPLGGALMIVPARSNDLFGPTDFDLSIAGDLAWEQPEVAMRISDGLLLAFSVAVVSTPFLANTDAREREWAGAVVGLEALANASLLSGVLKSLTGRRRPTGGTNDSFFSGHTAVSFAAATMLSTFAYEYEWLSDDSRWVVPTVAYSLAGFTGYLRLAGERHWLTDVLVGALVGTSVSYLTFAIRTGG